MTHLDYFFCNVDTQNDFVEIDGKLSVPEAEEIRPILARLTAFARENNILVLNTCDYHNEKSEELSDEPDFIKTFPPHCMENTRGAEYIEETMPDNPFTFDWNQKYTHEEISKAVKNHRNIVIRKDLFDVFAGNQNTENIVSTIPQKKVFVYGLTTNVCVDYAILGFAERGYEVSVIEDAIKELPKIPLPYELWKEKGVKFVTTEAILK